MTALTDMTAPVPTAAAGRARPLGALTLSVSRDEFLGLSAVTDLETPAGRADIAGTAGTLMHTALAAKLEELGLPWAPSAEAVKERAAEAAGSDGPARTPTGNGWVRKYAAIVLAAAALSVLWGGYIQGWQWTGFRANEQVWDWLKLLLLPVVAGTIPLWIQYRGGIGRATRVACGIAAVSFAVFIAAGYLVPLKWTGFPGATLWNWLGLILLPLAVASLGAWSAAGRSLRPYHKGAMAFIATGWVVTVIGGYALQWNWTGYQGNTLWDWLKLLLLPLVIPTIVLPTLARLVSGRAARRAREAQAAEAQSRG